MLEQVKMILFVMILGVAAATILIGTDSYTSTIIQENQELSLKSTILDAFEIAYEEGTIIDIYDQSIVEEAVEGYTFYTTSEGYVGYEIEGTGLWGPIEGFLALETDLVTIKSIRISYNEETPGLGGVVAEKWYLDKYRGKQFSPEIIIKKDADMSKINEVDAITGATNTSTAFQLLLNENYQQRKEVLQ